MASLFWLRDVHNGEWVLIRQPYFKNGEPKRRVVEERRVMPPNRAFTEAELLHSLAQAENDLIFQLASGDRSKSTQGKR